MTGKRIAIGTGLLAAGIVAIATYLGWPHLRFWYLFESLGVNAQGYPEYRHRQTGIVMVQLPGGKFWMGAQKTDPNGQNYDPDAKNDEFPVHDVTVSPFLIGKYEVTRKQWLYIMGSIPDNFYDSDNFPVSDVSWFDIISFKKKTNFSLPTECQWEYACRANSFMRHDDIINLDRVCWHDDKMIHTVGGKEPNDFGLYDMLGNVSEWCEDVYDANYYGKSDIKYSNPVSIAGSIFRVIRGGHATDRRSVCRPSCRYRYGLPDTSSSDIGFRVVWNLGI